jgi:hypothetical protein
METYIVGEKFTGRVINIYKNNLIVELEPGIIGRIVDGTSYTDAGVGSEIEVEIVSNNDQGIILKCSETIENAELDKAIYPGWNNWSTYPIGHGQIVGALMALEKQTNDFRNELEIAKNDYNASTLNNQKVYDAKVNNINQQFMDMKDESTKRFNEVTSVARQQYEKERDSLIAERDRNINKTKERLERVNRIADSISDAVAGMQNKDADMALSTANGNIIEVKNRHDAVKRAVEAKNDAYSTLYGCKLSELDLDFKSKTKEASEENNSNISSYEKTRNEKLSIEKKKQLEREEQLEKQYRENYMSVAQCGHKNISEGFNRETIREYNKSVLEQRFNASFYECPTEIPEYIMLGNIGLMLPNRTKEDTEVVNAVDEQASEYAYRTAGEYIVKLPYAQRLSEGISFLIRYKNSDRRYAQSQLEPLLFKLFMSFPAGKLEATMIDPLDIGQNFSDIHKIGDSPSTERVIDRKIWSKEKDIEDAIATLRKRLENITQAYGNDRDSRLKREVIRALAIADFPTNFNETALKDLHAIVRNSAALGVCVIICANDDELDILRQKNSSLVNEITQSLIKTNVENNRLMLRSNLFIELDDMKDALENKNTIIPQIRDAVERTPRVVVSFEDMFKGDIYDSNNWFTGDSNEVAVPIGIKGADNIVKFIVGRGGGSTEHHALIAGKTGAGKSTLLHTLIMSTLISYSPDDVQMYLLDFKEGVEFKTYTQYRLPSLRVIAINSEREFGLIILEELCKELKERTKIFGEYGVDDINDYMKLTGVPKIPKLLLIFDEVQELFRNRGENDTITQKSLSCINKLVMQGRALGIHLILACQDFHNCSGLENYFSSMAIRIAIHGSEEGATSILQSDNDGVRSLRDQPAGSAIYNGSCGVESANNFFQISLIKDDVHTKLLEKLDEYYMNPQVAQRYEGKQTRVLLTSVESNVHNNFNRLINYGMQGITPLGSSKDGYGLHLGLGFGKKVSFIPELHREIRDNLLVVSKDDTVTLSIFIMAALSVLYEELNTEADKSNKLIYIADLFDEEISDDDCDFEYLKEQFPKQVEIAKKFDLEGLINELYEIMLKRSEGELSSSERIFFMFFGINHAKNLCAGQLYGNEFEEITTLEKLQKLIISGPQYGINFIVSSDSIKNIERMLGDRYAAMFDKRIAYAMDSDTMEFLVDESDSKSLRGNTAVYMDINADIRNTHFRPYDIPRKAWVESYAQAYDEIVKSEEYEK